MDRICNVTMVDVDKESELLKLNAKTMPRDVAWCRLSIYESNVDVAKYLIDKSLAVPSEVSLDRGEPVKKRDFHFEKDSANWYSADDDINDDFSKINELLGLSFGRDANSSLLADTVPNEELHVSDGLDVSRFEHLSDESFNPKETSSHLDHTEKHVSTAITTKSENTETFHPFDLKQLPEKFYANVLRVIGPRTLDIQPVINSNRNYKVLSRALRAMTNLTLTQNLKLVKKTAACIAFSGTRQCFGRAIVGELDQDTKTAEIYFTDYLIAEKIAFDKLFECPLELQKLPVMWINVELTNISASKTMRARDVIQKLSLETKGRYVYCVVKQINTADPEDPVGVAMYEDETCNKLVYEKLIKEKFYYKRNEDY